MEKVIDFLRSLTANNNKDWFDAHRKEYELARDHFLDLVWKLLAGLQETDEGLAGLTPRDAVFRINRDVRFSHDKSPYKTNMGAYMVAGGKKSGRGGYYIHLEPGGCFMAGGIYQPDPGNLKKIRREIYHFPEEFHAIVNHPQLIKCFSLYDKNMLKRPPQGFDPDFPRMDYLKYKHYVMTCQLEDNWLYDNQVAGKLVERFKLTVPLNEFLNRAIDHAE